MKALLRAPAKRYVAQNYSPQFLRTLMPLFSACEKVTDREYFFAKPRPKVENLPIGNAACRRFTRWRIHLERVCVKPFRHCTDGRQCARCQGGSASGLGRTHGAGPRTQDGIQVAPAITTLCRAVAQFQEPRHFGCKWVHYWTQARTGCPVFHIKVAQMATNCATFRVKPGAV